MNTNARNPGIANLQIGGGGYTLNHHNGYRTLAVHRGSAQ